MTRNRLCARFHDAYHEIRWKQEPMARYSPDHKEKTRAAIVDAAAERMRAGGLDAVGVAGIMAECGLTHGGFYAHFASREALLVAAIERLFDKATDGLSRFEEKYGEAALSRYVDFYLSPRHRDDLTAGCPIPMLSADVSRTGGDVKAAFDAGLDRLTERLGRLMPPAGLRGGGKKAALALLGEMAGVLGLSRAMGDGRQSSDLLASKRKALTL
jgi:TetR/AcrR family transcriptional repressor of nem operon